MNIISECMVIKIFVIYLIFDFYFQKPFWVYPTAYLQDLEKFIADMEAQQSKELSREVVTI